MFNKLSLTSLGFLVVGLLLFSATRLESQTTREQEPTLQSSSIEMIVRPLPASKHGDHYLKLEKRLDLEKTGKKMLLMALEMTNHLAIPAWTRLGEIVCVTGTTRFIPVVYSQRETVTTLPYYQLPDWETTVQVNPGQKMTLYLGFILRPGENTNVENSIKAYALFRHTEMQGVHHSLSLSRRDDTQPEQSSTASTQPEGNGVTGGYLIPPTPPPATFDIGPQVNSVAAYDRFASFPTTAINPDGAPGLDVLLGALGKETRFPFWIGAAQAIEEGFDYYTAIRLTDEVQEYSDRYSRLVRTMMWLKKQRIILAVTEEQAYIATSVHGIMVVSHEAAEILLVVANKIVGTRVDQTLLDQTHVAPIPGTYSEDILPNPGKVIQIECLGIRIQAEKIGNDFEIKLFKKDPSDQPLKVLRYERKLF